MLTGLLGKKVGMTHFFTESGESIPVTVVQAGPVKVVQKKTDDKDGYNAVQVGFQELNKAKSAKVSKALRTHFKEQEPTKFLKEFKTDNIEEVEIGQSFDVTIFTVGDKVDISGTSKGKGFTGVMKRHGFAGGPASHGHHFKRRPGSIGQSATPAKVFKNKKMAGQHGNKRVTLQSLEIVDINQELNVLLIKGGIPGPNGRLVEIRKAVKSAS